MTFEETLRKFALPASLQNRDEIRRLLEEEITRAKEGKEGEEMLRTLCLQLFSLGVVEDALLIWRAKQSNFDAGCGLDIQFLCGAGLDETKAFLSDSTEPDAPGALEKLRQCEETGDFDGWTPHKTLSEYQRYYHLN